MNKPAGRISIYLSLMYFLNILRKTTIFSVSAFFIIHFTNQESSFENIEVIRESKDNIDIYYEDSQSIYVFENKIKSSINGTQKKEGITEEKKNFLN